MAAAPRTIAPGDEDAAAVGRAQVAAAVQHEHLTRPDRLDRAPLGVVRVAEDLLAVEVLAGGDAAEGDGLADEAAGVRVERPDAVEELVAQPALEELRRDGGGAGAGEVGEGFGGDGVGIGHGRAPAGDAAPGLKPGAKPTKSLRD